MPLLDAMPITVMVYQCVGAGDDEATQPEEKHADSETQAKIFGGRTIQGIADAEENAASGRV